MIGCPSSFLFATLFAGCDSNNPGSSAAQNTTTAVDAGVLYTSLPSETGALTVKEF